MPMCQSAEVVRRWGPTELLAHLDFRLPVVGLHLLCDVYICLVDRLEEEGCLEVLFCSSGSSVAGALCGGRGTAAGCEGAAAATAVRAPRPGAGAGAEARGFLGAFLPSAARSWRAVQAEVDAGSLRLWPTDSRGLQHHACFVLSGEERCPLDSVVCQIWRMFSRNMVSLLAHRSREAPLPVGSARLAFYEALAQRIAGAARHARPVQPVV
mmetsp:Transcript_107684/g.335800  ORF Transcript_107684/g.335800 Transcript_107684/m.335800 type:complete len:211 (+) Transcript_107684:378-1010(+)